MLITSIVLFLIAAAGGLYMATRIFRGQPPQPVVAVLHGLLAATGLALLGWLFLTQETVSTLVTAGLVVLVLAALGGFTLLSFPLRGKAYPKPVVVVHALVAVTGVVLLALALI